MSTATRKAVPADVYRWLSCGLGAVGVSPQRTVILWPANDDGDRVWLAVRNNLTGTLTPFALSLAPGVAMLYLTAQFVIDPHALSWDGLFQGPAKVNPFAGRAS